MSFLPVADGCPVIIGAGLAGLMAALHLAPEPVLVLSAAPLGEQAASGWAQGGLAAAVGADDSVELHLADTLAAGDGVCDAEVARRIVADGASLVDELGRLGARFDRDGSGRIGLGLEAGHSRRRIVHAQGDASGREILRAVVAAVRRTPSVVVWEDVRATRLVMRDGAVAGVAVRAADGAARVVRSNRVVVATGGSGGLFEHSTNPAGALGGGLMLAARAGAALGDLEFVQFHPTALDVVPAADLVGVAARYSQAAADGGAADEQAAGGSAANRHTAGGGAADGSASGRHAVNWGAAGRHAAGGSLSGRHAADGSAAGLHAVDAGGRTAHVPMPLVSEAVRGEGAVLVDETGVRFMAGVDAWPRAELEPRDVVSRAVWARMQAGHRVFLDATACLGARFATRFPSIAAMCLAAGVDPAVQPIPIRPAAHYHMGGIAVDAEGRSSVAGLWAAGEAACTGLHGANRLASNSLLEAAVTGRLVARSVAGTTAGRAAAVASVEAAPEGDLAAVRAVMSRHAGVLRDEAGLSEAVSVLAPMEGNAAALGLMMCVAMRRRTESRGGHWRTDYPARSGAWARRATLTLDEARVLARESVPVGRARSAN